MREFLEDYGKPLIAFLAIGGIIAGLVFGFVPYQKLEPTNYGLIYNSFSGTISTDGDGDPIILSGGGRIYVGFFGEIVPFPATEQTLEYTNDADFSQNPNVILRHRVEEWTSSDKGEASVKVGLDTSLVYKLRRDEIYDIYMMGEDQFTDQLITVSRRVIRDHILNMSVGDFSNPTKFNIMKNSLLNTMNDSMRLLHVDVMRFTVTETHYDEGWMEAHQAVIDAEQEALLAQVQANIDRIRAEAAANVTLIQAQMEAQILLIQAYAEANASDIEFQAIARRGAFMMNATFWNDTNTNGLVDTGEMQNVFTGEQVAMYMIIAAIENLEQANVYLGIDPTFWYGLDE